MCTQCTLYTVQKIHLADFMFILYIAQSRQSDRLFLQTSELGLPRPLNHRRVCPPLLLFRGDTLACGWGGHFTESMWPPKLTLRSQKNKHKVTLTSQSDFKVIKRRLQVFCWSCDGVPLKLNKKKLPSLQFVITDQMSPLSPLNSNDRSIPLR